MCAKVSISRRNAVKEASSFKPRGAVGASSRHGYEGILLHPYTIFPLCPQLIEINLELTRSGFEGFSLIPNRLIVGFPKPNQIARVTTVRLALERKMEFRQKPLNECSMVWSLG